jgi:SAM-dependent methyltransferase
MITSDPKKFWNKISKADDFMKYVYPKRTEEEFEKEGRTQSAFLMPVGIHHFGTVIDYGYGVGRITKHFKDYCDRIIGLDICDKFIEIARSKDKSAEYYTIDEFKETNIADYIFCVSVMQHNDKDSQIKIINHIYDLLKPGGFANIYFAYGDVYTESNFVHRFTEEEVRELAKSFKRIKITYGNLVSYKGLIADKSNELILSIKK